MGRKLRMDCTHQALDLAQRHAVFEVTRDDVVDTKESSDEGVGRLRTEGLLGVATRMRRVNDDRLMAVGALSVGIGRVGVGSAIHGVARATGGGTAT